MKMFPLSHRSGINGAALIIALGLVTTVVSPTSAAQPSPTPTAIPSPTATPTPACPVVATVQIASGGSLYKIGDILDPLLGTLCGSADNYGFRLQVTLVASPGQPGCASGGCVTAVTIISGIGYSAAPANPIRFGGSPTGTGFTANCTFN